MAYICLRPGPCGGCPHYRPDPDEYGRMACFAQQDEDEISKNGEDGHDKN